MAVELPDRYPFAERVPEGENGGARCSTCHYVRAKKSAPNGVECANKFYVRQEVVDVKTGDVVKKKGSRVIPEPADGYCCAAWSAHSRKG